MQGHFFQDKAFFHTMFRLATPIMIQNLITFSLGAVDMMMIGQLGDQAVAAVGLADQIFFLLMLMLFGVSSGATIFAAQYWGKGDIKQIRKILGLNLIMGILGSLIFTFIAVVIPDRALNIYTGDVEVIALGSSYLKIVGLSYVATAVAVTYTFTLRSIEQVKLPMIVGAIALILNTGLNYGLIFGHFGFPQLGVVGAAIATCGARYLEAIILLGVIYAKKLPLAASPGEIFAIDLQFIPNFLKTTLPVVLTEVAWSTGMTTYSIIYARISTEAIAAINIVLTIDRIAIVVFIALTNACAIMIGSRIGANEVSKAYDYAKRFLILGVLGGIPVGLVVMFSSNMVLSFYKVSPVVTEYANIMMTIMGLVLPIKIGALIVFVGILRSGGDTRFSLFADAGFLWFVGVPLAFFGAFILQLPVYWVYLLVITEEVCKLLVGLRRIFWGPWIHKLAEPEVVVSA